MSFGLGIMSTAANAITVTFDFAALADFGGGNEGDWNDNTAALAGTSFNAGLDRWTVGGLSVQATAAGNAFSRAYLDAGDAGLGVCSLNGTCAGKSDDNTGLVGDVVGADPESIILTFFGASPAGVTLENIDFDDRGHSPHGSDFEVLINGANYVEGTTDPSNLLAATMFTFLRKTDIDDRNKRDFYINTLTVSYSPPMGPPPPVPLPAALPLFAGALGVMGLFGWRRRRISRA